MKRIALLMCLAAASLTGCAAAGVGTAARLVEKPAIVATETGMAAAFGAAIAKLDALEAEGTAISNENAQAFAKAAAQKMQILVIGRIAYDATLRGGAPPATVELIDKLRSATDRAFEELQGRLARYITSPAASPAPI